MIKKMDYVLYSVFELLCIWQFFCPEDGLNQVNEATRRQVCQGSFLIYRSMWQGPHSPERR